MKIRFDQETLAFAASLTQSVANPQSSLPILGNTLITARGDQVVFEASDMESCVRYTAKAEVVKAGTVAVDAKRFYSITRELPPGQVELNFSAAQASITTGDKHYRLTTQNAEDFPQWPELQAATTVTLEQLALQNTLKRVLYALPLRDPRKVLLGANFEIKDNELACVGTDGRKLGLSRCDLSEVSGVQPATAIIPHKILNEVSSHLKSEGTVRLLMGERQIAFDMGDLVYLSNRIDGIYPSYQAAIPTEFTREIPMKRSEFLSEVRSASLVSEERNNSVLMRFEPGRVRFTSRTYEVGSYHGTMKIAFEGEAFDIAFNHQYLTDTFRAIEGEDIVMKVKQNTSPVVFMTTEAPKSLFLVMPITLTDVADLHWEE